MIIVGRAPSYCAGAERKGYVQTDTSDERLIEQIQTGVECAFDEVMQRYKRPVLNFVYRLTGEAAEAEDIALDVFVRAYRALTSGGYRRKHAEFSTWLFQIARNAALDALCRKKRHPTESLPEHDDLADAGKTAPQEIIARETGAQIAAAVALLPEDQRTALILAEYEDRSQAEIAAIMQTSAKSVEARLYRARQFLRQRLASLWDD